MMGNIKSFFRKITPSFIWRTLSFIKILIFNRDAKSLRSINFLKNKNKVIVLGNGPSLKNDLEKIAGKADDYDFVCVNNFCSSPYYDVFKPNKYVFLDGYFFKEKVHPDWVKQREETFKIINECTTWKMQIFLPLGADERVLKQYISNENVEIIKVNAIGLFFKRFNFITRLLISSGFFGPAQNNVLIYAIYYSIWSGYSDIYIYGADMTIYKNIDVNSRNELFIKSTHFNKTDSFEKLRTGVDKDKTPKMSEMMFSAYRILLQHEILNAYGCLKSVKIINKSSVSQIDAYFREAA